MGVCADGCWVPLGAREQREACCGIVGVPACRARAEGLRLEIGLACTPHWKKAVNFDCLAGGVGTGVGVCFGLANMQRVAPVPRARPFFSRRSAVAAPDVGHAASSALNASQSVGLETCDQKTSFNLWRSVILTPLPS